MEAPDAKVIAARRSRLRRSVPPLLCAGRTGWRAEVVNLGHRTGSTRDDVVANDRLARHGTNRNAVHHGRIVLEPATHRPFPFLTKTEERSSPWPPKQIESVPMRRGSGWQRCRTRNSCAPTTATKNFDNTTYMEPSRYPSWL